MGKFHCVESDCATVWVKEIKKQEDRREKYYKIEAQGSHETKYIIANGYELVDFTNYCDSYKLRIPPYTTNNENPQPIEIGKLDYADLKRNPDSDSFAHFRGVFIVTGFTTSKDNPQPVKSSPIEAHLLLVTTNNRNTKTGFGSTVNSQNIGLVTTKDKKCQYQLLYTLQQTKIERVGDLPDKDPYGYPYGEVNDGYPYWQINFFNEKGEKILSITRKTKPTISVVPSRLYQIEAKQGSYLKLVRGDRYELTTTNYSDSGTVYRYDFFIENQVVKTEGVFLEEGSPTITVIEPNPVADNFYNTWKAYKVRKKPYLEIVQVVPYAYNFDFQNYFFNNSPEIVEIPKHCLNIYRAPTNPSTNPLVPSIFRDKPEFIAQFCSDDLSTLKPPEYYVVCNCDPQCPPGTCAVECGDKICCYGNDGIAVTSISIN